MSGWALSAAQRSCCVAGSSGSGKGGERAPRRCHSAPGVTPSSPSRATSSSSAHSASIPAAASGAGPARRKWGHRRDGNQGNAQTGQRQRGLARAGPRSPRSPSSCRGGLRPAGGGPASGFLLGPVPAGSGELSVEPRRCVTSARAREGAVV